MSPHPHDKTTDPLDLSLEFRFANGTAAEFYVADAKRIRETLRSLAAPRLFAQPHLLLASEDCARMIPCKGIDMILARTSAPLPLKFPLKLAEGLFDIVEQPAARPDPAATVTGDQKGPRGKLRRRDSQVEIRTLGGWIVLLEVVAMFRGNAADERQFFSHLPDLPTIPLRLERGGFGLINTANILQANASPKPETLTGITLPLTLRR